jgi:hypothetical protein
MKVSQYNRRNFLSSLAILSAGTAFGSTAKYFSPASSTKDLQQDWKKFWKNSGGQVYHSITVLDSGNNRSDTKGHSYKYGEIIYLPKENILAQPTWIFWNGGTRPADVIVTFFENNHASSPVIRLNRYEMDVLYRLSTAPGTEDVLSASLNNSKRSRNSPAVIIKTKTSIKKNAQVQDISYYKQQELIFKDTIILNS